MAPDGVAHEVCLITGRFNIVLGLVAVILAGISGLGPGLTFERCFQNGRVQITFCCQLTGVGRTDGVINVLFGLLIGRATCSDRLTRPGAVVTALARSLPLGTAWGRGPAAVRATEHPGVGKRLFPSGRAP